MLVIVIVSKYYLATPKSATGDLNQPSAVSNAISNTCSDFFDTTVNDMHKSKPVTPHVHVQTTKQT